MSKYSRATAVALRLTTFAVASVLPCAQAAAQSSVNTAPAIRVPVAGRTIPAVRAVQPPNIDGRLDDAAWASARVATDFTQQSPNPGEPASQRTEARILFTGDAMLVAMRMYDTRPDSIVGTLARRDYTGYSDWAHVIVDSRLDRRTAYRFTINPSGVKRDGFITGDSEWTEDLAWDAVWDGATRRDSLGWTAEFRIPLSQLRFSSGGAGTSTWGVEFGRDVARRGEKSFWVPMPVNSGQFVSLFGTITDVAVGDTRRRLEITPYAVARGRVSSSDLGNPLRDPRSQQAVAGADFKVGLTSDLTLTGTVNPDFGQVEADPSQVNLTGGETFFAEARPFFTEGSNLFQYTLGWGEWIFGGEQLFYSRRIGRRPQLDFPDSANFTSASEPTSLLGAAKVSGRAFGFNVGLLSATTAEETGRYTHDGGVSSHIVEPLTHYGVYRLGRDFAEGAGSVGLIGTSMHRQLNEFSRDILHSESFAGGIEARRRFWNNNWAATGNVFGSSVGGSSAAIARTQTSFRHLFQRDPVNMGLDSSATSLSGLSSEVRLVKNGGLPWRFGFAARVATPGFDVNDVGFMNSSNLARVGGWFGLERPTPTRYTRRWSSFINYWGQRALIGGGSITGANWWNGVEFQNRWNLYGHIERYAEGTSASQLRGGPVLRTSGYWNVWSRLETDRRKTVTWMLNVMGSPTSRDGSRFIWLSPGAVIRPAPQAELTVQPSIEHRRSAQQFVSDPTTPLGTRWLVGDLRQRTMSVTLRGSYALTRALTVQAYAQPFASSGRYARIGEVTAPLSRAIGDRVRWTRDGLVADADQYTVTTSGGNVTIDNPDFRVSNFNANVVMRWEYAAGSTFYAVWNQGRSASDVSSDASTRGMANQLLHAPSTNVFLLKWSHYLGR